LRPDVFVFFSSRRRHTRSYGDWSSDVCSSDLPTRIEQTTGTPLPAELPFKAGEQLNFNVFVGTSTQPVANVSSQVRARAKYFNRDGILFAVKAQTLDAFANIFFDNDQINS